MRHILTHSLVAALTTAFIAVAAIAPRAQSGTIPRTSDGKPDLSGTWQSGGVSLLGDPATRKPGTPAPAPAAKREPPSFQPWASQRNAKLTMVDDPIAHCLLPGVPRIITMPMPLEIVQTKDKIVILYEAFRAYRIIPIRDTLTHPDDIVPTWMGDSVGKWEGDTLVVDVIGFNDRTWLTGTPSVHSEALHVVERYRRTPEGTIEYEAVVEDPKALTKPWVTGATLRTPPNARVEEYECLENNQDPQFMRPPDAQKTR